MASEQDTGIDKTEEQQTRQELPSTRARRSGSETGIYSVDAPGVDVNSLIQAKHDESGRGDVTAATVARMMGVATASELKLVEGKLDLLNTKLAGFGVRLEKMLALMTRAPTGADLERIDVQIGALKSLIKDSMAMVVGEAGGNRSREQHAKVESKPEIKLEVQPPGSPHKETVEK